MSPVSGPAWSDLLPEEVAPLARVVDIDGELFSVPEEIRDGDTPDSPITVRQHDYIVALLKRGGLRKAETNGALQLFRTKRSASVLIDYLLKNGA